LVVSGLSGVIPHAPQGRISGKKLTDGTIALIWSDYLLGTAIGTPAV
jgi:hypothetical protein